jgi:hypothetical protein
MKFISTIRTLLTYALLGLPAFILFGWLIPFINVEKRNYAFVVWFAIDIAICSISHGTYRRSISGWTGQKMHTHKRYQLQAKFIDFLLKKIDGPHHCYRSYLTEKAQGLA